ncbi:MAG: 16S rRNA (cytosine(1402)-N(4))-methyltransferase RsmH [Bacteroidota bacterium]
MPTNYHVPVLLSQCIEGLNINPEGIYVDVTFGGGGHSREILNKLTTGRLIAFDQDADAHANTINDERFTLVKQNFRFLRNSLKYLGAFPVDGILADLGVSSHQFDEGDRGFSIRFDGKLDLRMDIGKGKSAASLIESIDEYELINILRLYGELDNARRIAYLIIKAREENPIETTYQLMEAVKAVAPRGKENKFFAKLFQALRIVVNDEIEALRELILQSNEVLKPNGRLVVLSYNSLEDRLVKNYVKSGNFEGKLEKDFYGNILSPMSQVTRKVVVPDDAEIELNSRARSAKLRIAEKK